MLDPKFAVSKYRIDPGLLLAVLLPIFAVLPLLTHAGLPNTADGPVHLMRQAELNQAWQDGIFYPRWAPDLAYGHGMPLFNYAPPLLYHVTQIIHLVGLPLDSAMKGTLILMMIVSSAGMYLFARDVFGPYPGVLAAVVYLYAPYRLRELYVQGNYGQFSGLALYPAILWSFFKLLTTRQWRYPILGGLFLAALLTSHNISTMLFLPLLALYVLFLLVSIQVTGRRRNRSDETGGECRMAIEFTSLRMLLVRIFLAVGMGLGLSAFFWLPAFGERGLIRLSGITSGFFDFRHNFIHITQLLALPQPLDLASINPYYPLSLGVVQLTFVGLAALGLVFFLIRIWKSMGAADQQPDPQMDIGSCKGNEQSRNWLVVYHAVFFLIAFLVFAFLTLAESRLIWEILPFLELTEFPWRLLGPAILCAAVLAGAALHFVALLVTKPGSSPNHQLLLMILAAGIILTVGANLYYLFPDQFIPWGTPSPAEVTVYESQSRAVGTTSTGEFLPRWADRYPLPGTLHLSRTAEDGSVQIDSRLDPSTLPEGGSTTTTLLTARETLMSVNSPAPFEATFRALYWPGWQLYRSSSGNPAGVWERLGEVRITEPDGLIEASLPEGQYFLALRLSSTPVRRIGTYLSLLSLAGMLGLTLWAVSKRMRTARSMGSVGRSADTSSGGAGTGATPSFVGSQLPGRVALMLGGLVLVGLVLTRPLKPIFQVQSPPGTAFAAQYRVDANFGDQVRLLAYDLPPDAQVASNRTLPTLQVVPGEHLSLVLYWQAVAPLNVNYRVFAHLDGPGRRTFAGVDEANPENIPTSQWPPSLYVRNALTLPLPLDLAPGGFLLSVGLYDSETGVRLPVVDCQSCPPDLLKEIGQQVDSLPVARVFVQPGEPLREEDVPKRLDVRFGDDIDLLGYQMIVDSPGFDPALDNPVELTLYWRASQPVGNGYTVFIHALDDANEIVGQFDAQPLSGLFPTTAWPADTLLADVHNLVLPATARTLVLGLYDPGTLDRLLAVDGDGRILAENGVKLEIPRPGDVSPDEQ